MKERPIMFNAPMVRAILDGTKTQTRRVVNNPPPDTDPATDWSWRLDGDIWYAYDSDYPDEGHYNQYRCPHGVPGDLLWVKETYARVGINTQPNPGAPMAYRADTDREDLRWRSPRYMPRWASRIDLRLTAVRVERVQEISEGDAAAEGALPVQMDNGSFLPRFEGLWDSINAKRGYGWGTNPWVWVLTFERVRP